MLTFPEEVVLLLLDDEEGIFLPVAKSALELAMTGSVLMELALVNRIDTDLERLTVIDPAPTGNVLLDHVLKRIADGEEANDVRDWINTLSEEETAAIQEQALGSLVGHGILKREEKRLLPEIFRHLCIFRSPRYFSTDPTPKREVAERLAETLLSDEIPDVRGIALASLIDACGIMPALFREDEIERRRLRIELLRNLDLIGREITRMIADISHSKLNSAAHPLA